MKKRLKLINLFAIALSLTATSCNNDDETNTYEITLQDFTITIDENPTSGQSVGTVQADGDGTLSFNITSQTPAGALSVNTNTGELTIANASLFDFETNPEITANITVSNSGNSETATVTISLTDLNEIGVQHLTATIDENPTNGQIVGVVQADGNGPFTFSIESQTPAGALSIDGSSGELTVADATLFDFETNNTITGTVAVAGAENTATLTININNLIEINADDLTVAIDENPTDGQVVGSIQVNGGGNPSFSISSQTPAAALNINASTGELSVADPNLFDFETNPVITADITVEDVADTTMAIATINLNDVDEVTVQQVTLDIDENPSNGAIVGTVPASSNGSVTYAISFQNPAGAFNIDPNTGELSVADETLFDFESNPNMLATITAENAVSTASANALVNLNDMNEIGEFKYGGVIFWLDGNGGGLVCDIDNIANPNAPSGITWSEGANMVTGATGTAIGTGQTNTSAIVANHGGGTYAAWLCAAHVAGGHSDWYLPSLFELHEIGNNLAIISATAQANGGAAFTGLYHWSSTEMTMDTARVVSNNGGTLVDFSAGKNNSGALVRAVRTF